MEDSMRSFLATGLLLSLSISGLLAGAGCITAEQPPTDSGTDSAGVTSDGAADGSSCKGDDGDVKPPPPPLPPPLPPPPSGACWLGEMGDGFTCYDTTALHDQAYAKCAGMGAALMDFELDTLSCAANEASKATFSCCAWDPPPPPPPEPDACWTGEVGYDATCHDVVDLKDEAYIACRNEGADLAGLDYELGSSGCAIGEETGAVYTCCPAKEPLPSPLCWTSKIDHGDVCQAFPTLDDEVSALCAGTDQTVFHIGYGFGNALCPEGEAASVLFTCCP
jgi:hypothetical protein